MEDAIQVLSDRLDGHDVQFVKVNNVLDLILSKLDKIERKLSPPTTPISGSPKSRNSEEVIVATNLFDRRMSNRNEEPVVISDRRKSLVDNIAVLKPKTNVQVTRVQPDFSYIKLEKLRVREAFDFFNKIVKYEQMNGMSVPAATLVNDYVRTAIMARCPQISSEDDFYHLNQKELLSYVRLAIKPVDKIQFSKALNFGINFWLPEKFKLTILSYSEFYNKLLSYRREFIDVYDFLAHENKINIPRCDNKEGGLISIFIGKIPVSYGKLVVQQLSNSKFDNVDSFLSAFYDMAEEHFKISIDSRKLNSFLPQVEFESKLKPSHRVHNIRGFEDVPDEADAFQRTPTVEVIHTDDVDETSSNEEGSLAEHFIDSHIDSKNTAVSQSLSFVDGQPAKKLWTAPIKSTSVSDSACFRKLFNGVCNDANCKYSHDVNALDQAAADYEKKLKLRAYRNDDSIAVPRRLPPTAPQSNSKFSNKVNNILAFINDSVNAEVHIRSVGMIKLKEGPELSMTCLFDTGAIHASYINKSWLDQHRNNIRDNIIVPVSGHVVLADGITTVNVSEKLLAVIEFTSPSGRIFETPIEMLVMENLGEEAIIGLPDISSSMISLLTEMLEQYNKSKLTSAYEGEYIWSSVDEAAEEDLSTKLPCSFRFPLHFMEMSYDDAVTEFYGLFDTHISEDFKSQTDIVNYLKTEGIKAFVPQTWEGIKGVEPIEFNWKEGLPESMKPPARPINPRLIENARKEFNRLLLYFYVPSDSPIASPLVVAPKATQPFLRFCGDYAILVNKYIETGHYPIPHVLRSLEKIILFKYFLDFDLANSFHQFKLGPVTSRRLSVQTPWGQFQPLFLPEGVPPASGILQKLMCEIFADFDEWLIVIFDNILALAHSYEDAFNKTKLIVLRCIDRGLVLKFKKSWLGFTECNFFGYKCSYGKFCLTDDRKQAIVNMKMPVSQKGMRQFLGCGNFFHRFMPNYSQLTAPLTDMTKNSFDWNKTTWTIDYEEVFNVFKQALINATSLFYPNYELDWILRADASNHGVGFVLMQLFVEESNAIVHQPIIFGSKKFSDAASKWSTYGKEAFAMFYAFKTCEYYLRAKHFLYQGDHANLQWIEKSLDPMVIRWRIYLQGFSFKFQHIKGSQNIVADWQSRMFNLNLIDDSVSAIISQVHGGRSGHHGARRTWGLLNLHFPGHKLSYQFVADYIADCPVCQKVRLGMNDALKATVRHLKTNAPRSVVGIDYLSLELDKFGNSGAYVLRDHFTKLVFIHPTTKHDATSAASALFIYCVTYGAFDVLMSDPGSELMSDAIVVLNNWFGIHHRVSLVDRHESNGVEGANKQILRHLIALLIDERIKNYWSSPSVIGWVSFLMNKFDDSESGASPYLLTFGSDAKRYFTFADGPLSSSNSSKYLAELDSTLRDLKTVSAEYQSKLVADRSSKNEQNLYQPGDFILFKLSTDKPKPSKLLPRYIGPYVVIKQVKNDVECRHVVMGNIRKFFVEDIKLFRGTKHEAMEVALVDADQYVIDKIIAFRGDPIKRTTMEFLVRYVDGDELWQVWSDDLFQSTAYEDYCKRIPSLFLLLYRLKECHILIKELQKTPITEVSVGSVAFVDLRCYGYTWYSSLSLPNADVVTYVLRYEYKQFTRKSTRVIAHCAIFLEEFELDHLFVKQWGSVLTFDSNTMIEINTDFVAQYPAVLPSDYEARLRHAGGGKKG